MTDHNQTPEQIARDNIDEMLLASGWKVQQKTKIDLNDGLGQAVREYQTDDEAIGYEARENWYKSKLNIERVRFFRGLVWMRKKSLVSHGKGEKIVVKKGIVNDF